MSWTPYDHEAEERRDSERFADANVFDGPDPSEYMDYLDPADWDDLEESKPDYEPVWIYGGIPEVMNGRSIHKPGMIDENAVLKDLLAMLFAVLASLMLWILVGAAVMRWVLR